MKKYIATIDATHGGFVNKNNTWYLEDHMSKSTKSWLEPYEKPMLLHHEKKQDAIGYVKDAQYISTKNTAGKPQGFIQLKAVVSDMNAVQKMKDGRYRMVSINADAKYARCSICDQLIHKDGLCEHKRGSTYENKKCFWYVGQLTYKEVSPVNIPADEYARIVNLEEIEDESLKMADSKKPKFSFVDSDDNSDVEWDDFTEEDLQLAYWLSVEIDSEMEDAKLSTKKRKDLPDSTFCGPNRSFPVPDCAHVTAARRLIGRYKGPGNKEKILACINRKAKKLGCDKTKSSKDNIGENMSELSLQDILTRSDVKEHIEGVKKSYETQLSGMSALDEKVKSQITKLEDLEKNVKTKNNDIEKLREDNESLRDQIHKNFVDRVFELRTNLKKPDVIKLKDEKEITAYKAEIAKRSDESLKDSISDLSNEEPIQNMDKVESTPDEVIDDVNKNNKNLKQVDSEKKDKLHKIIFSKKKED